MASLIPIGTCLPGANAEGALRAAMDYGFETGSVNFHMKTMDKAGLAALAERLNRIRDGRDFQITTLGFYLNPIENAEHFACLKTVIDCAHLFGATHVSTFAGALSGRPVEESIPKFGEVFRELAAHLLDVRPLFHRHDEFAELSPPVAEVIYAHGLIAEIGEYAVKRRPYHSCRKMPDVEGLCDVDGTEIYAHRPAVAVAAVCRPAPISVPVRRKPAAESACGEEKVEISSRNLRPLHDIRRDESVRKLLCYHGRRFAQAPRELETRQCKVAEFAFLGYFQRRRDFRRRQCAAARRGNAVCYLFFKHISHIEAEEHHVVFAHDVILALAPHLSFLFRRRE